MAWISSLCGERALGSEFPRQVKDHSEMSSLLAPCPSPLPRALSWDRSKEGSQSSRESTSHCSCHVVRRKMRQRAGVLHGPSESQTPSLRQGRGSNRGRARLSAFKSQLGHVLAVRPWASHLALPGLSLPICKIKIIAALPS